MVAAMRAEGNDLADVEAKRALDGFPDSIAETLSAFSNTPGGGLLVLGLDERSGFSSVGVYDHVRAQAALASAARRKVDPPATFTSEAVDFEGHRLVVARVHEVSSAHKPCRVKASGRAYLRSYDGDYPLSAVEEQALLAGRGTPRFDDEPVAGAAYEDLSKDLVESYVEACRATPGPLATMSDQEVLFRTGVLVGDERTPSVAGLLLLGVYPQQFLPNIVIQASSAPHPSDPPGTRAGDAARFDGPIPRMLDEALRWIQRNTRRRLRSGADGHNRDEPEYPTVAVRELLSNALIHRDLGPHAMAEAITVKLEPRQLVIANPGGLYSLTVDRLGKEGVSSLRNQRLARIGQNVRISSGNARVVEALATGIPTVLAELTAAGMTKPRFHDQAIRFAVQVPNHTLLGADDLAWLARLSSAADLSDVHRHALVIMRHGGELTNRALRETFPMDSREAQATLRSLVDLGLVDGVGLAGGRTYRLAARASLAGESLAHTDTTPSATATEVAVPTPPIRGRQVAPRHPGARAENIERILDVLRAGEATAAELVDRAALTPNQVSYALRQGVAEGVVVRRGGQGRRTTYSTPARE
ncbi:transcriptional regulator [Quadrisphaera setariae]|uniref:Transcriptional regulator n=1 Tax=Quadrisphaera setariae TaxID=2593304 RepID=A0A5C8ZAW2_9ACTN|nr:transcriptional regulator [Quadrisphaera setariae]